MWVVSIENAASVGLTNELIADYAGFIKGWFVGGGRQGGEG